MQEEYTREVPKKDYKKNEFSSGYRYSGRSGGSSYDHNAASSSPAKGTELSPGTASKGSDNAKRYQPEDKAATLMNYRKAKGLCYKCGMKWSSGNKYSTSVSLHVVGEL